MDQSKKEKLFWKWQSNWNPNPTRTESYLRLEANLVSLLFSVLKFFQFVQLIVCSFYAEYSEHLIKGLAWKSQVSE